MSKFDSMRFAEAFGAAVLGAAAYDHLKRGNINNDIETVRKFQRALILAANRDGFIESISERYLDRIGEFSPSDRIRYLKTVLQPSEEYFDERLTSLVIFDHALQQDREWVSSCRIYGLGLPTAKDTVIRTVSSAATGVASWVDQQNEKIDRRNEERSKTLLGKVANFFDKLI